MLVYVPHFLFPTYLMGHQLSRETLHTWLVFGEFDYFLAEINLFSPTKYLAYIELWLHLHILSLIC